MERNPGGEICSTKCHRGVMDSVGKYDRSTSTASKMTWWKHVSHSYSIDDNTQDNLFVLKPLKCYES